MQPHRDWGRKEVCVFNGGVVFFSVFVFSLMSFFSFFCSFLVCIFCLPYLLAYLNGHPSCGGGGGSGVNAFAIFIFSAQFKSGTDQSDKPKTPKFISKSLFTT